MTTSTADPTAHVVVWAGHMMAVLPLPGTTLHRHAAYQLAIGLDGPVSVRGESGPWEHGRLVTVRSGVPHELSVEGRAAIAWADGLSTVALRLRRRVGTNRGILTAGEPSAALAGELQQLADDFDAATAMRVHTQLVVELTDRPLPDVVSDPLVARACELLRRGPEDGGPLPVPAVAEAVGLSPPHLRARLRQLTGVPPARYRLWWRMMEAARMLSDGWSIADAAASAGFADGAHLSRAFRSQVGLAPRFLTRPDVHFEHLDDRFVQDSPPAP